MVEGLIGLVIIATAVTAIFSVIISSFSSDKKTDSKEDATFVLKKASDRLKVYVTADGDMSMLPADLQKGICSTAKDGFKVEESDPMSTAAAGHDISCLLVDKDGNNLYPSYPAAEWRLLYKVTEKPGCNVAATDGTYDEDSVSSLKCRQIDFSLETKSGN